MVSGTVDVLKVDIEGAEADVFANLDPGVLATVRTALVECHPELGASVAGVVSVLEAAGMRVQVDDQDRPVVIGTR